jgi:hypothetical protein
MLSSCKDLCSCLQHLKRQLQRSLRDDIKQIFLFVDTALSSNVEDSYPNGTPSRDRMT